MVCGKDEEAVRFDDKSIASVRNKMEVGLDET